MQEQVMATDYLVVGSGAVGMAFADTILAETDDVHVTLVDLHDHPGGHWNDAYPFVRLHQPSSMYGVNSRRLGSGTKDMTGTNAGLDELASGSELLSYYAQLMQQQFLPTGRVTYVPMSRYAMQEGAHTVTSLVSGRKSLVDVRRKLVDTRYLDVQVPSTHRRSFEVAGHARCVALNELPRITEPPSGFVVIGAGKTAIDACLWLLTRGVDPAAIHWIMPRDSWLLDRAHFQAGQSLAAMRRAVEQMEAVVAATSPSDLYARLEAGGHLLRLDPDIEPTQYRCATVTRAELEQLRRIRQIVRMGRVRRISEGSILLEQGTIAADPRWLYIDCSARAFRERDARPVFDGRIITPQTVRTCMTTFSAALTAHVELSCGSDEEKNALCTPVPLPDRPVDWLRMTQVAMRNQLRWSRDGDMRAWLAASRLDHLEGRDSSDDEHPLRTLRQRYREVAGPASLNLEEMLRP